MIVEGVSHQLILSRFIFFHIASRIILSQLILASDFTKKYEGDLGLGEANILKKNKKNSYYFWEGADFFFGWAV